MFAPILQAFIRTSLARRWKPCVARENHHANGPVHDITVAGLQSCDHREGSALSNWALGVVCELCIC